MSAGAGRDEGAGKDFDPQVVRAFEIVFSKGELEVPEIIV